MGTQAKTEQPNRSYLDKHPVHGPALERARDERASDDLMDAFDASKSKTEGDRLFRKMRGLGAVARLTARSGHLEGVCGRAPVRALIAHEDRRTSRALRDFFVRQLADEAERCLAQTRRELEGLRREMTHVLRGLSREHGHRRRSRRPTGCAATSGQGRTRRSSRRVKRPGGRSRSRSSGPGEPGEPPSTWARAPRLGRLTSDLALERGVS